MSDERLMSPLELDTLPPPAPPNTRAAPQEDAVQALAKTQPGWRDGAWWYLIEVINPQQIMITGDVPIGFKKDGSHKWERGKAAKPCRVVVSRQSYHEHCDAWRAAQADLGIVANAENSSPR